MSDHDQKPVFYRQGKVSHVDSTSETAKAQILCCLEEYLESCDQ